ncbi:hypothetical protein [Phocaeicola massiliensis]|uniref:hypothetical protein n=1 Tax=Phocaeicola massiliensis TaxID=204516 RepID=UPI000E424D44|nr:hypothetical protein [Phocaeicola massiliensis]RGE98936.1 hypothetical protein DW267_11285 [Bacteroides sp. AM22-3LB]
MNKKFLSAILFGALMVSSTGTFVSCKDYDDDIENLQGQITANADAIKALQDLVGSGKYVTSVAKTADGHGITFTFNQGDPVTITLDDETGSGDVVKVVDGILYINDEPQELKVATSETKPSIIMQDGVWAVLQEDGTYKSTGVPVSGVSVAGSEADGFTLTIFDKDGNKQEVKVPSASSLVTSIAIAVPVVEDEASLLNEKNVVYYGSKELINVSEVKYPKDAIISALNEDGTRGVAVNVVVTPTNIDPADLKFNLVNSEGATIFEEAVVSTPKGALQRAAMDGVYTLHFALKEGVTVADIKKGSIISQDDALAVVCGKAATAFEYKAGLENAADITQGKTTDNYKAKDNTYVKLGETYSLFGKGYAADPSANPNAAAQAFLTKLEGVSDIALSLDENLKSLYGITIDGTNFTISNEAAYGKEIIFTVKYTNSASVAKNSIQSANLKVTVQKAAVTAGVTLKASHVLSTDVTKNTVYLPLADLAASVTAAGDKIVWNNANAFTYKTVANNTPADGFALTSSKKYGATPANLKIAKDTELGGFTFVKSDKKTATTKLSEAAYLAITVNPEKENVTADVYSALIQFIVTGNDVDGQSKTLTLPATVELTLTNPTSAVSRIPMYFDGDKLAAYGDEIEGNLLSYDVKTAYNNANKAVDFTVTAKADKDEWDVINGSTVEIPLDKLYTETQKFEVSYKYFKNAKYNAATETIYITGQSPIKDGTITVSKTTLDLATGSDSFLSADVAGKDAFNKAYKLLNSFTAETNDTPAAQKDVMDARIADIELVATGENAGAFKVTPVLQKVGDDNKLSTWKDGDDKTGYVLTGWTIALKPNTAIQNGATITFDLNITDKWGVELPAQKVSLTVKK